MENFIVSLDESPGTDHLLQAIRGKGAFRRLKDTAASLGLIAKWYRYREEAMKEFVRDWAAGAGIAIADDTGPTHEA